MLMKLLSPCLLPGEEGAKNVEDLHISKNKNEHSFLLPTFMGSCDDSLTVGILYWNFFPKFSDKILRKLFFRLSNFFVLYGH